jgi:CRP-like cAMP-binding protein
MNLLDVSLFRSLEPQVATAIAGLFIRTSVQAGQVIFREGEQGHSLVVILDGLFELVHEGPGEGTHLADVQAGRLLGLVSLIDPGPRTATLRAMEDGEIAVLDQITFQKLWDADGDAAASLHHQMALVVIEELRSAQRKLCETLQVPLHFPQPELEPLLRTAILRASETSS